MSDKAGWQPAGAPDAAGKAIPADSGHPAAKHRRRSWRIVLGALASLLALAAAAAAGAYTYVSHMTGSFASMHVAHLETAGLSAGHQRSGAMNVVVAGQNGSPGANDPSGLIEILHLDASRMTGGVVSIHPYALVRVPGHGVTQVQNALAYGGPSLLVQTITQLTHVQINHYARIDLPHVTNLVNTIGGVDVPTTSGFMHFDGTAALAYIRDTSVSQFNRVLRQEILLRAVMRKILRNHLLTRPATMVPVLHALISMLTVDSNFTVAELVRLAGALSNLGSGNATFVVAPFTHAAGGVVLIPWSSRGLWLALRWDALPAWALQHPAWRVPEVAP